jgi:hypothetical protein
MKTNKLINLGLLLTVCCALAVSSACSKGSSFTKFEGYMVEATDGDANESTAFNDNVEFDGKGTKIQARRCWLEIKAKAAGSGEIAGGQTCSFVSGGYSKTVKVDDGMFEETKTPDGKSTSITVKLNGTTGDGAKYRYVFRGQKI